MDEPSMGYFYHHRAHASPFAFRAKGQTPPQYDRAFIDKLGNDYVSLRQNHGLVVGIIQNGEKTIFTFGETEKGNKSRPPENALFEIGQMSEVFTTSILAVLESQGKISSQEAVRDVLKDIVKVPYYQRVVCQRYPNPMPDTDFKLPALVCFPDPNTQPEVMILCDLATHSAGLPDEPSSRLFAGKNPYKDFSAEKLRKFVSGLPPNEAFGYEYAHSMIGIALLAEALTHKTKMDYVTLLQSTLLDPLSMKHTFAQTKDDYAVPFLNGHGSNGKIVPHRDYNALIPAAGIRSNMPDLLTFLAANLSIASPKIRCTWRYLKHIAPAFIPICATHNT
ncbi:MAG: beta-lactamase family protein [Saprospiraceae bacterium]|nr:beta-lactamase family protein [Saprospiraceae bacterium]